MSLIVFVAAKSLLIIDFFNSEFFDNVLSLFGKDIKDKTLDQNSIKKIGFPLVDSVVQRSLIATGGTVLASKLAINYGLACNTAGGSHHANFEGGAGYCVFNDVAVAAQYLLDRGLAGRILIVDLDVHQGNGNADIFLRPFFSAALEL